MDPNNHGLFFFSLALWHGMWDLSSLTRERTLNPCMEEWCLNHWTAREVPIIMLLDSEICLEKYIFKFKGIYHVLTG